MTPESYEPPENDNTSWIVWLFLVVCVVGVPLVFLQEQGVI